MSYIRTLVYKLRSIEQRLRGTVLGFYIRACGGSCGNGLRADRRVRFKHPPHQGIRIGSDVVFGMDLVIDVEPTAVLSIGDRVKFTGHSFLAASDSVHIGADTIVAEFVSIRDANHRMEVGQTISSQGLVSEPVRIGDGVWIGRGAAVLKGATLGTGAVVAANAVVIGIVSEMAVVGGVPSRVIRLRSDA